MKHSSMMLMWDCHMGKRKRIFCLLQNDAELNEFLEQSKDFIQEPDHAWLGTYMFVGKVKDET